MAEIDEQVLEGLLISIEEKIEEARSALSEDTQMTAAQVASTLQESLESMMDEVRIITQQNSAIYDLNKADLDALKESIEKLTGGEIAPALDEMKERLDMLAMALAEQAMGAPADGEGGASLAGAIDAIGARVQQETNAAKDELMGAMAQMAMTLTPEGGADNAQALDNMSELMHAELDVLKDELMGAMAQMAMNMTPEGGADNSQLLDNFSTLLHAELDSMKDELEGILAQMAMNMTPEGSSGSVDNALAMN